MKQFRLFFWGYDMRKIKFTKMAAAGNDFIVMDSKISGNLAQLSERLCDRKYGIGADGVLLLEKSRKDSVKMRIFNADGSEAEMCGNGARCAAFFTGRKNVLIETKAGIIESTVKGDNVKIKLTEPKNVKLDMAVRINKRSLKVNFVDTGVPHAVIFVSGIDKIDVVSIGRQVRYHRAFSPKGTNVDFVEELESGLIKVRTYERGVEDETLACGTGSVASAVIFALKTGRDNKVNVRTRGGDVLTVYFSRLGRRVYNVWLEGKAGIVFTGSINI